jgi:hypothetical protein
MNRGLTTRLLCACAVASCAIGPIRADEINLRGVVRDNVGNRASRTQVRVYDAAGRRIAAASSADDGTYNVTVDTNSRSISVEFDNPSFHVRSVKALSTQTGDNHLINPVLLDRRGPASFELILEQMATYENLFWREYGSSPTRETGREMHENYRDRIREMPDPRKAYALDAPQREVLGKLSPYQRRVVQYRLELLEYCYDWLAVEKWRSGRSAPPAPDIQ